MAGEGRKIPNFISRIMPQRNRSDAAGASESGANNRAGDGRKMPKFISRIVPQRNRTDAAGASGSGVNNTAGDGRKMPKFISQIATAGEPYFARVKRVFQRIYEIVSSTLGLLIILILYSFLGAAIFTAIEGGHEREEKVEILDMRNSVMHNAWNFSQMFGHTEEDFKKEIGEELHRYEMRLHEAFSHGVNSDSEMDIWDFWGAFLFCATVYSTIGYGHITPATDAGKVMTMAYALFGIPLCLVVMAHIGKKLTFGLKYLWAFIRRFYYTGQCRRLRRNIPTQKIKENLGKLDPTKLMGSKESSMDSVAERKSETDEVDAEEEEEPAQFRVDEQFNLPPIVAISITIIYILIGAAMYRSWESTWSYLDAFYFIFISISTVGFGDITPEHPRYFLTSSIYILLGLSLVAMVINVFMEVVHDTIHKAKSKVIDVGQKMGINLSMEEIEQVGADDSKKNNGEAAGSGAQQPDK